VLSSGSDVDDDRALNVLCQRIERLLRMALSDWYGFLSREALVIDRWNQGVPWWVKRVPDRLDVGWALMDLKKSLDRKGLLVALFVAVDEVVLAMERDEEVLSIPPNMSQLHEALKELCDVVGV
jgi:hypothetical protein